MTTPTTPDVRAEALALPDLQPHNHPDFVGGIVWTAMEIRAIQRYAESALKARDAEIERLRGDAGWISVADQMPPAISTVIAHGRKYGDRGYRPKVYTTFTGTRVSETVEDEEITHWMPLPRSPEDIDQARATGVETAK